MADGSHISWTGATWNIINGCTVISPGCKRCYAMKLAGTRLRNHPSREGLTEPSRAGPVWNGMVRLHEPWLDQPKRWTKPRMIFVCAHGDLGHEGVDDHMMDKVMVAMLEAPQHTYQILTKRPERFVRYFKELPRRQSDLACHAGLDAFYDIPDNWWFGISAEDQQRYDERWPVLARLQAKVRWVSAEPLLEPLDITKHMLRPRWIVVGAESGQGRRVMPLEWAYQMKGQCDDRTAFFLKQISAERGVTADMADFPEDLRVQEFPA